MVTGHGGHGRDADSVLGGGTDRGGGVLIWDRDRDRLSQWEDNVENITLGTKPNAFLEYAPVLLRHHPIIIILEDLVGQLERDSILVKTQ